MNEMRKPRILVTGAAGRLGRLAVDALIVAGADVVAGSRDPAKLNDIVEKGIEVRQVDFDEENTLEKAFVGIDRLLLVSTDAIAEPGRRLAQHLSAVRAAAGGGVKHIAYTSIMNPGPESAIAFVADHRETEKAIVDSGLAFTFLRNSFYQENQLLNAPAIAAGVIHTASGSGRASYVSIADCARAAAGAVGRGIPGCFDITGPASLTIDEVMALAGQALGRSIAVEHLDEVTMTRHLTSHGLPDWLTTIMVSFERTTRLNLSSQVTDRVRFLTGRNPESIERLFTLENFGFLQN